ncbi:CAP domain-containing protein [Yoonia sp. SS1-5]|uniref:CAP domain-containing protein n=1 Tax=Yoonia rhodophyticola TaxID=3137370 RepID=A0AAN0MEW0_9RHOB
MKIIYAIVGLVALAACGGSGGGNTSVSTLTAPSVAASTSPTTASAPAARPSSSPSAPAPTTFAGMLNDVRLANGAAPVTFDARLGNAAQNHANDMLAQNYFSHTGLNGSSPGDRITAAGYRWRTYGENIAQGYQSEAAVLQGWVNSPGHQRNNVNPNFEDFGLARAGSGSSTRWVLVLAAEQ